MARDFREVMELLRQSGLKAGAVVTDVYRFEDAAKAFKDFSDHAGEKLKVLVDFQ